MTFDYGSVPASNEKERQGPAGLVSFCLCSWIARRIERQRKPVARPLMSRYPEDHLQNKSTSDLHSTYTHPMSIRSPAQYTSIGRLDLRHVQSMQITVVDTSSNKPGEFLIEAWLTSDPIAAFAEYSVYADAVSAEVMRFVFDEMERAGDHPADTIEHLREYLYGGADDDEFVFVDGMLIRLGDEATVYSDFYSMAMPPWTRLTAKGEPLPWPFLMASRMSVQSTP